MILTDFQKQLIHEIANEDIRGFTSFLKLHGNLVEGKSSVNSHGFYGAAIGQPIWIPKNKVTTLNQTKEFITIWRMLERINLITRVKTRQGVERAEIVVWENDSVPFKDILHIHRDYEYTTIVVFPQLNDFIARGFLTEAEYSFKEEKKEREKAQKRTILTSAIVAGVSVLIGAIANYYIYTNQRIVEISNPNAFQDTLKVQIIPKSRVADTLKSSVDTNKNVEKLKK